MSIACLIDRKSQGRFWSVCKHHNHVLLKDRMRYERFVGLLQPSWIHGESLDTLTAGEGIEIGPTDLIRCSAKLPDLVQLVKIRRAW